MLDTSPAFGSSTWVQLKKTAEPFPWPCRKCPPRQLSSHPEAALRPHTPYLYKTETGNSSSSSWRKHFCTASIARRELGRIAEREKQTPFSLPHLVRNSQFQEAPSKNRDFQNITGIFKSTESANTLPSVASVFANFVSVASFRLINTISLTPSNYWLSENPQNSVCAQPGMCKESECRYMIGFLNSCRTYRSHHFCAHEIWDNQNTSFFLH